MPSHNFSTNTVISISGGSNDSGVGVSTVQVSIEQLGGSCYGGGAWGTGCPNYVGVSGTVGSWSFSPSWQTGYKYVITAKATDLAGNDQTNFVVGTSSVAFTYETDGPTVGIDYPDTARSQDLTTLSGNASDAAPGALNVVQVRVKRLNSSPDATLRYWNPVGENFNLLDNAVDRELAWFNAMPDPGWDSWSVSSAAILADMVSGQEYEFNVKAQYTTTRRLRRD